MYAGVVAGKVEAVVEKPILVRAELERRRAEFCS